MIISNSEVSMASKVSYSTSCKVEHTRLIQPAIDVNGIALVQQDKEKTEDKKASTDGLKTSGENDFLSSFNYCLDKKGRLQEVETPTSNIKGGDEVSSQVKVHTLSYILRLLLFSRMNGDNNFLSEIFNNVFGSTDTALVTESTSYQYSESQEVTFASEGTVITEDGRKLSFNYSFSLSASFSESYTQTVQNLQKMPLIDPLVIKLDSNPGEISDQKFFFDLDADGEEEEISTLGAGQGFLALDKNEDGKINDGLELFGVKSGDGFRDLAIYDEDGNGWIDENDSIFEKLRIWSIDENGQEELYTLKESDVGAIYLQKQNTNFFSRDREGNTLGVIRNTGIFLHESTGQAGLIQHVDLAT